MRNKYIGISSVICNVDEHFYSVIIRISRNVISCLSVHVQWGRRLIIAT